MKTPSTYIPLVPQATQQGAAVGINTKHTAARLFSQAQRQRLSLGLEMFIRESQKKKSCSSTLTGTDLST